ncbi:MAG: hypothetical protein NC212_05565 [Staphylococcus sp.]|nr:hypothetical protein [Staphylococcus sp.]
MMSILRRAFGFSPDTEEEEGDYDPTVPTYAVSTRPAEPVQTTVADSEEKPAPAEETARDSSGALSDDKLPADIFDAVIEIFNQAQPDFVRECLNVEAQRQYILNSLSESLRGRVSTAISTGNRGWQKEKEGLEKRIAELEGDDNELTRLRKDNRRLQLSVDRQKRALLDRINDLESQVARQTEEKERYYTRKRLPESEELTKANARVKDLESEQAALKAEISTLKASADHEQPVEAEPVVDVEALKAGFEQEKAQLEHEKAELASECEHLREEVARQTTLKEQLEMKTSMSDVMINDLRNQAAAARGELEKFQHEQEAVMEQIKTQLDGFEDLKARKDAKINELQEANTSLRQTIETNLYNQANSEMKLRREIKDLKAELDRLAGSKSEPVAPQPVEPSSAAATPRDISEPSAPAVPEKPQRRRGRPKKVKTEPELDSTDWFAGAKHDDPDFGYHEPPRRPVNDNEAQLTLF